MNANHDRGELTAATSNIVHFDTDRTDLAQIPGPREYRIQDFWGDEPASLHHSGPVEVQTPSRQQMFATPDRKPSWKQRLLIWIADPFAVAPIVPSDHLPGKTPAGRTGL